MFPWFDFIIYVLSSTSTPGPNTLSSMSNGSQFGFRKTIPYLLGIWCGFTIVSAACAVLCSTLNALIPMIQVPMRIIGACYILYLAWKLWHSGTIDPNAKRARCGFRDGFLFQFVNPKIYIYCILSMQTYILPFFQGRPPILLCFAALLAFVGFFFDIVWAAFGSLLGLLFSRYAKIMNTGFALLLAWCAFRLLL